MKITKRQLKRIIRESCGDIAAEQDIELPTFDLDQPPESESSPCPYSTAEKLKVSGMDSAQVLEWISTLLSSYLAEGDFNFSGDVGSLAGDEAFGVGYEAGSRGL
jgi:hypothetical protein